MIYECALLSIAKTGGLEALFFRRISVAIQQKVVAVFVSACHNKHQQCEVIIMYRRATAELYN
jgi:hypothetical protein